VILVISTSSPMASIALFDSSFALLANETQDAAMAAGGACLRMLESVLQQTGHRLDEVELFVADTGPGSFTGVKVGVTLAKTFGFAQGKPAAGLTSFDLISGEMKSYVPSRKGEWLARDESGIVSRVTELPTADACGYGSGVERPCYPDAAKTGPLLAGLESMSPEVLVPTYFAEPSISTPKTPYGSQSRGVGAA